MRAVTPKKEKKRKKMKGRMISILHNNSTKPFFKYYHFYILYKQDNIMHFNKLLDTTVKENSVQSQFT